MYQPSIKTKKIILNGKDKTLGGNIIIPIDIKTEAITMSIIKNGTYIKNPISKARLSSLIINAGMVVLREASSMLSGFS